MTDQRLQELVSTVAAIEAYRGLSCGLEEVEELAAEVRRLQSALRDIKMVALDQEIIQDIYWMAHKALEETDASQ